MKKWIGIIIVLSVVTAFSQAWYIEAVDTLGNVGQYASLAIDAQNRPHIAYFYADSAFLRYATWNGSTWEMENVDRNTGVGGVGLYASLALGPLTQRPQIAYYDMADGALKWAHLNDLDQWEYGVPYVGLDDVGQGCDIAIGVQGSDEIPHFAFYDVTTDYLLYARPLGAAWSRDTVDTMASDQISIALDPSGSPHIAYYANNGTEGFLKYAHLVSGAWVIDTVDYIAANNLGLYPDIVITSNNIPYINFYDSTTNRFKYARWTGSAWTIDVIDNSPGTGMYGAQILGSTYVSYYDMSNADLKYGYSKTYLSWHNESVDTTGDVGQYTSIALTHKKDLVYPHIAYYDVTNGDLKYATRIIKDVLPTVMVAPPKIVRPDSTYIPAVTVLNQGNTVAACSVTCVIKYQGLDVHHSVRMINPPLNVDEETQITFDPWTVLGYNDAWYNVTFRTWMADDSVPQNDSLRDSVHATNTGIIEALVPLKLDIAVFGNDVVLSLPNATQGEVYLFDVTGSRRITLESGILSAGEHKYSLDKRALPNGVYFVRFSSPVANLTRKAILVR